MIKDLFFMTATPEFEKFTECVTDISSVSEREMFVIGFRLSVKLMIDVMK